MMRNKKNRGNKWWIFWIFFYIVLWSNVSIKLKHVVFIVKVHNFFFIVFPLGESDGKTKNERTLDHAITIFEIFFIQHTWSSDSSLCIWFWSAFKIMLTIILGLKLGYWGRVSKQQFMKHKPSNPKSHGLRTNIS